MTSNNLQKELFSKIKDSLAPHISIVDAIAELLDISYDSVYRRIRGEKPVSLEEVKILCDHFHLSLDQVLQLHTNKVLFTDAEADNQITSFTQYLEGLIEQLQYFNGFSKKEMFYLSKDVPPFYFFYFPEIAAFKSFFWCRSILNEPGFEEKQFGGKKFEGQQYFDLGQKLIKEMNDNRINICDESYENVNRRVKLQI